MTDSELFKLKKVGSIMRILIPTILSTKHKVGVGEYLIGLLDSLQKVDKSNEYFILTTKENRSFFNLTGNNFHEIVVNIFDISRASLRLQYLFFSKFKLPHLIKTNKIDIIHEPCSWFVNKKFTTIVTIHDIVELHNAKYSFLFNYLKQKMILSSINLSTSIISVSKQTTSEIKNINNRNIYTIYNGISSINKNKCENSTNILEQFNLESKKYFIFIGTLLLHKNLISLLQAFKLFNNIDNEYKLVLAGKEGNATRTIKNYIKENQLEDKIILTGYFEDKQKSELITNAISLLLISKNEGFGFPILEAQSFGIPVITSNTSSMKEIANGSAILINPNSIESISEGMNIVASNKQKAKEIIKLGYSNITRFSWIKSAEETLKVYTSLVQNMSSNK